MNCDDVRVRLPEYWGHALDEAIRLEFAAHLDSCEACRQEAESLGAIWTNLGLIPAETPAREMRSRFYEALEAYRQGLAAAEESRRHPVKEFFERYWPKRPAMQFAVSMACLAIGLGVGYAVHNNGLPGTNAAFSGSPGEESTRHNGSAREISQLRGEIDNMRQLVALSLLQQSSPSERMKGVNWSYRVPQSDTEVLAALLYTINHDENVNVRLAAVDALHYFAESPVARKGLLQAIPKQTEPLVQIALIDLSVDLRDSQSVPVLQAMAQKSGINPEVKQRVQWALEKLQ
ncbi:MAG TPA: zf-HC2 domain-containing protein [Bryobacteraceae bacterium]|nr:zf-HC2 domain-containing protein [Bryobacteraceae bacterium]